MFIASLKKLLNLGVKVIVCTDMRYIATENQVHSFGHRFIW